MAGANPHVPIKIDWQRVAMNIRHAGQPLQVASVRLGRSKGWLSQIARGEIGEPFFTDGIALLNFHLDLCGADKHREICK